MTLAVPGLVAGGPWFLVLWRLLQLGGESPKIPESLIAVLFTLTVFGAGMVVDGLGSLIEAACFDRWRTKRVEENDHLTIWDRFLLLTYNGCEPVGHRYLRGLVQAMKFELNTPTAVAAGLPAALFLLWLFDDHARLIATLALSAVMFGVFLYFQAWTTHGVLSKERRKLVQHFEPHEETRQPRRAP